MSRPLITIVLGTGLGLAPGNFGQCSPGTCPLTSTWWRGAFSCGTMGLLFKLSK